MQNTPEIPKIPKDLLNSFSQKASEFYELAPWELFGDSEFFGVLIPETKEIHFVSIMGGGGQCFGLATYRGTHGLNFLLDLLSGELDLGDPFDVRLNQDGLLLEFTTKKFLDPDDLKLAKESSYKSADSKAWPLLRNLRPGYVPWYLDSNDMAALIAVLTATHSLLDIFDENPDCLMDAGDSKLPIFVQNQKTKSWKIEYWGKKKLHAHQQNTDLIPHLASVDELELQRARSLKIDPKFNIELHDFFSKEPVLEKDRPFFPRICTLLEEASGFSLGVEILSPETNVSLFFRDTILRKIIELGKKPKTILVTKPEHVLGILVFEEALGIEMKISDVSKHGEEFESSFRAKFEPAQFEE